MSKVTQQDTNLLACIYDPENCSRSTAWWCM